MRTTDGIRLETIVRIAEQFPGIHIESGSKHPYLLKYAHAPIGNCALAGSTSFDRHIVPWLKKATQYNKHQIYNAVRTGEWPAQKYVS